MFEAAKKFYIEEVEVDKETVVEPKKRIENKPINEDDNKMLRNCPQCNEKTLKIENGCNSCINPECGYGKCDV